MNELILIWCCIFVYVIIWSKRERYGIIDATRTLSNYLDDPYLECPPSKNWGINVFYKIKYLDEKEKDLTLKIINKFNKFEHKNVGLTIVTYYFDRTPPDLRTGKINSRIKDIFSRKIWTINPWDSLNYQRMGHIEPETYNLEQESLFISDTNPDQDDSLKFNMKELLNRDWIINYDNFSWNLENSRVFSQSDSLTINNMLTFIDNRAIYLEYLHFGLNSCDDIKLIEGYDIYAI